MALNMTNYIDSVKRKLRAFLQTYFTAALTYNATIDIVQRRLVTPLTLPHIRILLLPGGATRGVGAGRMISDDGTTQVRAEFKDLLFAFIVTTDLATGGEMTRDEYSSYLESTIIRHREDLGVENIRNPMITPPTPFHIPDNKLIENYHTFTCTVMLEV